MLLQEEINTNDLHLQFLKSVDAHLAGMFRSAFKGHGYELSEIRKYTPGDEIRLIDWNVTARTGDLYIRQNLEDKELSVYILADASASGKVHSLSTDKQSIINHITILLTMLCLRNRDQVSIIKFTDCIEGYLPPSKSNQQGIKAIDLLFNKETKSKKTSIKDALQYLMGLEKKNALVFLISDFIDIDFKDNLESISNIHDLVCLQVSDPFDESLPNVGLIEMTDIENGTTGIINTANKKLLNKINTTLAKQQQELKDLLQDTNCDHVKINASDDLMVRLQYFFSQRIKRRNNAS